MLLNDLFNCIKDHALILRYALRDAANDSLQALVKDPEMLSALAALIAFLADPI